MTLLVKLLPMRLASVQGLVILLWIHLCINVPGKAVEDGTSTGPLPTTYNTERVS